METIEISDKKTVIIELTQGKKLTDELKKLLLPNPTNDPRETSVSLLDKILASYNNALAQLAFIGNVEPKLELEDSPRSFGSDPDWKDQARKRVSKKRKISEKRSERVRVSSGAELEGQLHDGYNWRKYGQKDILGANHPRAYYRCTHQKTQGCLATKQVQQTDEDPLVFEVTYKGNHSCTQQRLKPNKGNLIIQANEEKTISHKEPNFKVEIPELIDDPKEENTIPLSISSTPTEPENVETHFLSEFNYLNGASSHLVSPASSESYLSIDNIGLDDIFQCSGFDFAESFLSMPPTSNLNFQDWDIGHVDFDAHFINNFS